MFNFPTDPLWSSQWTLYNTGSVTKTTTNLELNVVHAWIQKVTGEGVVLSVVDDGLDYSHYDLSENYVSVI
jgi:subtilisin family serine protease